VKITVRLFTTLRELAGTRREELEFSTVVNVEYVLDALVSRYGKEFGDYLYDEEKRVRGHLQLLINGKRAGLLEDVKTMLKDGDQLAIIPPVGGG
jgi:molybdopterin synthase sulfur carrier subunit